MKRRRVWVLVIAAMFLLLNTTVAFADSHKASAVTVKTKRVSKKDTCMLVNLRIPVFNGIKDKKVEARLNKSIESELTKNYQTLYKEAVSFHKASLKDKNLHFLQYEVSSNFKVRFSGKNLISLSMDTYEFTGGAHGNPGVTCYNIDTKTGKLILLKNLFKSDVDYKTLLNTEIAAKIKELNSDVYTFESITDNQAFYIKDGKLYIVFQSYEIAPYSEGRPTFSIALSKLAHSLHVAVK